MAKSNAYLITRINPCNYKTLFISEMKILRLRFIMFILCGMFQDDSQHSVKHRIQMVWFYTETKSFSLTTTKFVKHFAWIANMASPQNKPS